MSDLPPGVCRQPRLVTTPFQARITIAGKRRSLGFYATAEDAHIAYLAARVDQAISEHKAAVARAGHNKK